MGRLNWLVIAFVSAAACGADSAGPISFENLGFEVRCGDQAACGWQVVEGVARFAGTWHPEDPGIDLSGAGRAVVDQRTVIAGQPSVRDYVLEATVLRDPGVQLRFELDWYAWTDGDGDYWARDPALVRSDPIPVEGEGLERLEILTSVPSAVGGLVLRIVKEGEGRCWVDEIAYHPLETPPKTR